MSPPPLGVPSPSVGDLIPVLSPCFLLEVVCIGRAGPVM